MTFSSKSDEFELPRVGEIWKQTLANLSARIYLVVVEPRVYAPSHAPQIEQLTLLDLEAGRVRRVNARSVNQKNGFQLVKTKKAFTFLSTYRKVSS